jgi:hypothetical protein
LHFFCKPDWHLLLAIDSASSEALGAASDLLDDLVLVRTSVAAAMIEQATSISQNTGNSVTTEAEAWHQLCGLPRVRYTIEST